MIITINRHQMNEGKGKKNEDSLSNASQGDLFKTHPHGAHSLCEIRFLCNDSGSTAAAVNG